MDVHGIAPLIFVLLGRDPLRSQTSVPTDIATQSLCILSDRFQLSPSCVPDDDDCDGYAAQWTDMAMPNMEPCGYSYLYAMSTAS